MVMVRGHALEWFWSVDNAFTWHWSRMDGCTKYRQYLEHRIRRDVALFAGKFQVRVRVLTTYR